ncbi:fluoroquinolones export permease proteinc [Alkalithermobacter paradoxus]|uniref:Fluoroquinolones export permease proteinc n=2 Tax=Alkalithermobacter paradoxus TaxID=29349 RepID=A0A1V4I582_9FIRM|nr:fluoroquinolones export permease proteinc [[Clostridium] thermoalcaliphilum]
MGFMMFYPIIFGLIGRYFLPWIAESSGFDIDVYADLIVVILTLLTPQIYGALIGFSILDDRDDNILTSIRVTPLNIHQFLSFRLAIVLILSFIACSYVMYFSNIGSFNNIQIISIAFLASLSAPMTGLFINCLSKNKIEGFAAMKGAGSVIIFPIISLFFIDKRELFFSFVPSFYPAKAISSIIKGESILLLSYNQYYFIGLLYVLILNFVSYRLFLQRTKM